MTYPGINGVGPIPASTTGWQVRQSRAGSYPGGPGVTSVIDAMGTNAPAAAVVAAAITMMQEYAVEPHPIEMENFELDFDQSPFTPDATFAAPEVGFPLLFPFRWPGTIANSTFDTSFPFAFSA